MEPDGGAGVVTSSTLVDGAGAVPNVKGFDAVLDAAGVGDGVGAGTEATGSEFTVVVAPNVKPPVFVEASAVSKGFDVVVKDGDFVLPVELD